MRRRAVNQTLASWSFEGFEPDATYLALLERYVNGNLTLAQISQEIDVAFGVNAAQPSIPNPRR